MTYNVEALNKKKVVNILYYIMLMIVDERKYLHVYTIV